MAQSLGMLPYPAPIVKLRVTPFLWTRLPMAQNSALS